MHKAAIPRVVIAFFLLTFAFVAVALAFGPVASSEVVEPDARPTPVFGRLAVSPLNLAFLALNFSARKGAPATEPRMFTLENTGRSTSTLNVQVGAIGGANPTSFSLSPAAGLITLAQDQKATYTVNFTPLGDGRVTATIAISSSDLSGQRGPTGRTIHLSGVARGPIPTPSFTPTPTATATPAMTPTPTPTGSASPSATATASGSPTATATSSPIPQGPGTVSKNSANAPGIIITGTTVTAYIPLATDSFAAAGFGQAVIENGANPLPGAATYTANRVNSCTPAASGEIVCSEGNSQGVAQFDLIPASAATSAATSIATTSMGSIDYLPGACSGCGALVDDLLGTNSAGLGIISSFAGFFTLDLGNIANMPIAITTNPSEPSGANFGYDATHHMILNANYQITNVQSGTSTPPHFQIFDITNPASPLAYDLNNDQAFFLPGTMGTQCNGANNDNQFPEATAFDNGGGVDIAYVTFHTPPNCENTPPIPDTVALFDMTRATFTQGTAGMSGTWDTSGKQIQSLTGDFALDGIDIISIEPNNHVAILGGGPGFGALQLPSTSGTGTPAIVDWVSANMPNDPDGNPWFGWSLPDGVATYVSPNTTKPTGLMLNALETSGNRTGIARYAALVDINALLAQPRDQIGGHQVAAGSDGQALVTNNVVKFVLVR